MRYVTAQEGVVIPLGRQDENSVETVIFPTSTWAEAYGEGSFQLLNKRAQDTAPYPCDITVDDNGNVNWVVEAADVYYQGYGCVQITYVVDDAIAKTVIYSTSVLPSLGGGSVPTGSWVERVYQIADDVAQELEQSIENTLQAEAWAVGQRAGVDVPDTDATYHNNAKYYSEVTSGFVEDAQGFAEDAEGSAQDASESATAAALSATQAAGFVGSPLTATTAAGMTDHAKVYVYTGSESGYNSGHWYYWNGSAWADGGVYNAVAVDIATSADLQAALYS